MTPPLTDAELDHRAEVARLDGNYLALELIRELRQAHARIESMAAVVEAAEGTADEMEHDVGIAERHRVVCREGGQHVGTGGQLGALPPSGLSAVRRYAQSLRAALSANRGAK